MFGNPHLPWRLKILLFNQQHKPPQHKALQSIVHNCGGMDVDERIGVLQKKPLSLSPHFHCVHFSLFLLLLHYNYYNSTCSVCPLFLVLTLSSIQCCKKRKKPCLSRHLSILGLCRFAQAKSIGIKSLTRFRFTKVRRFWKGNPSRRKGAQIHIIWKALYPL